MGWKLDREFFKFLVGLYVLAVFLAFAATGYESFGPGWSDFATDFTLLSDQHFGEASEDGSIIALSLLAIGLLWHLAAAWGLRQFHRWSRWSFWISEGLIILAIFAPNMMAPVFLGPLGNLTEGTRLGLFATIVLLAYSREHGSEWFKAPLETLRETF